jgi:hypothetical protein
MTLNILALPSPDYSGVHVDPLNQLEPVQHVPSPHDTCPVSQRCCTSLDKAKRSGQLSRWHLAPAKAAALVGPSLDTGALAP